MAKACGESGCALIGGETAEMPGFYPVDEYDLAGFSVGVVDKSKVLDKTKVAPGDVLLALPSSGVHSNGFSLVRKIFDVEHCDLAAPVAELGDRSLGETLLTPTKIYVKPMIYFGSMAEKYIILLQILDTRKVKDLDVATKVSVQLQLTDPDLKSRDRVVKKSEKDSLYAAMDVASVWLDRALAQ